MKPACWPLKRFMKKYQMPTNNITGNTQDKISLRKVDSISPLKVTGYCCNIVESS